MAKVKKKSVVPIYAVGIAWLLFALFLPLYSASHYIAAAIVSAVVFTIATVAFPSKEYTIPEAEPKEEAAKAEPKKQEKKSTGDPKIDALIDERDKAVSEMRRLNDTIKDETISAQIDHLEVTTTKIIDYVVQHPDKLPQIRKFMNYYLPTTLKLLNAYDRMGAMGVSGENIDGTMTKIGSMLDTIVNAFDKQLDALFGDEALDISTDITVMENMLAREGLSGMQL